MTVTLELPSDIGLTLQQKAQSQGLSVSDLLVTLAKREAERPLYFEAEVNRFLHEDCLPPDLSDKVQRLLGRLHAVSLGPDGRV